MKKRHNVAANAQAVTATSRNSSLPLSQELFPCYNLNYTVISKISYASRFNITFKSDCFIIYMKLNHHNANGCLKRLKVLYHTLGYCSVFY